MSEFSEHYHLRSECSEHAVGLLRQAHRNGYVFEPANGWVSFVADDCRFQPDERIIVLADHPILHYVFAEDFGWEFHLFAGATEVSRYGCSWDEDIVVDAEGYSRSELMRIVPSTSPALLDMFERRMQPASMDELFQFEPFRLFAEAIGLQHYRRLEYGNLARDFHAEPGRHPGVIKVV